MQDYQHKNSLFYFFQWFDIKLISCVVDKYFTTPRLFIPGSSGAIAPHIRVVPYKECYKIYSKILISFGYFGMEHGTGCCPVALSIKRLFLLCKNKFIIRWGCWFTLNRFQKPVRDVSNAP